MATEPSRLRRAQATLLRRLLIAWLLAGAIFGTLGFLLLFDRRNMPEQLFPVTLLGGLAAICIAVLVIWLRLAMRRTGRDQA